MMTKKIISALLLMLVCVTGAWAQGGTAYGKEFKAEGAWNASELTKRMGDKNEVEGVVLAGTISQVCQAEGCWMKLKNEAGADVFVKFKDHAFVIPKDLSGHKAKVYGTAVRKVVSVEDQRHFAEDAGKSEAEIAAITEPKTELRIDATGVVIE